MDSTTILLVDGTEIYLSEIDELVDEYQRLLPSERNLQEAESFTGLVAYLYEKLFAPRQKMNQNSSLDYNDIHSLDTVWNKYVSLCGKYKQTPSLFEYCSMTGISPDTLTDWQSGRLRGNDSERVRTVKRWKNLAVSALEKKAVNSNSVGAIFSLKAAHGWREAAPLPVETDSNMMQLDTPEQIMQRHSQSALEMPVKPNLD